MNLTIKTPHAEATQRLAATLAAQCEAGDCLLLIGDLGAGKTTFARGFIRALCDVEDDIVSPTFTLAQTYPARGGDTVWHFDLYRLKKPEEALELGLEEALDSGITLIEWPQLLRDRLPDNALEVQFAYGDGSQRTIALKGKEVWRAKLAALESAKEKAS